MPSVSTLLLFAATAAVVIAIPGPSVIFLVSCALANGSRAAVLSVLGNAAGEFVQVVAVAFGVGVIVQDSVVAFTALKLAGGLYLVYLGIRTYRSRRSLAQAIGVLAPRRSDRKAFSEALFVGVTNPKTIVFLAAILPQFVVRGHDAVAPQILLLGAIFAAIAVISDTSWVLLAGRLRSWFARSPRRLELVGGSGGLAIAAVGAGLLVSGRKS